jgi:3-phosphoshikimate 1-carboxyvinyltransferase
MSYVVQSYSQKDTCVFAAHLPKLRDVCAQKTTDIFLNHIVTWISTWLHVLFYVSYVLCGSILFVKGYLCLCCTFAKIKIISYNDNSYMMETEQAFIQPSAIQGNIVAPVSKSAMQRACAAALLHQGTTIIHNPGRSNDDLCALQIIQQLGATVADSGSQILVLGNGVVPVGNLIHCGESGLGVRMFTPIAALSSQEINITGSGSLLTRPLNLFDEVLPQLGVQIQSHGGYLPLQLKGPLTPADICVDGSLSSQFLTGWLMAFSAANASGITITVNGLTSKPYIDLTLAILRHFQLPVPENHHYRQFVFPKNRQQPFTGTVEYTVEGDWSGAAFLLVAGAIAGDISVTGLNLNSTQADRAVLAALQKANAVMDVQQGAINIKQSALTAFEFDATDCPDLFPPLVALAAYCTGNSIIKGVGRLAHKESNRGITLQQEFGKMGVTVMLKGDEMTIEGTGKVHGAAIDSNNDHRIAMAGAVAALGANGAVTITGAAAIKKSYPGFYNDLRLLGADIRLSA